MKIISSLTEKKRKNFFKKLCSMVAVASLGLTVLSPQVAVAETTTEKPIIATAERISGDTRYETAVSISKRMYPDGANAVVLARGDVFADALAGVPLATNKNAPLLLTPSNKLNSEVLTEIRRLDPDTIYILGGESAVSAGIENQLSANGYRIQRLSGANRYDTAKSIAMEMGNLHNAVIAYGHDFPDALSISAWAASNGIPILLTDRNTLPKETIDAINKLSITKTYIVGGTGVVSSGVQTSLQNLKTNPSRISGNDRYGTNIAINKQFSSKTSSIYIATGLNFPDALAGSVLAAKDNSAFLLVNGKTLTNETRSFIAANEGKVERIIFLGGKGAITDSLISNVLNVVNPEVVQQPQQQNLPWIWPQPTTPGVDSGTVYAPNPLEVGVRFNRTVDRTDAVNLNNYVIYINGVGYGNGTGKALDEILDDDPTNQVKLLDDKKTVIFRLENSLTNGSKYAIDVVNGVLSEDKTQLVGKYADTQKVYLDTYSPVLLEASLDSSQRLKLVFSEPIQPGLTITMDGVYIEMDTPSNKVGDHSVLSKNPVPDAQQKSGTHTIVVHNAKDYAKPSENVTTFQTFSFNVSSQNQTKPTVQNITQVKENASAFDINFNKQVSIDTSGIIIKKGSYIMPMTGDASTPGYSIEYRDADGVVGNPADATIVRVTFNPDIDGMANPLYGDKTSASLSVTVKGFKDKSNLVGADITRTVSMSKSYGVPKVVSEVKNSIVGAALVIEFNQDLESVDSAKISVYDKSNVQRTIQSATIVDDSKLQLELSGLTADNIGDFAKYRIVLQAGAVKEGKYGLTNASATTYVNAIPTGSNPQVVLAVANVSVSVDNVITIQYNQEMGSSAATLSNYKLDNSSMPSGSKIALNGTNDIVTIELPDGAFKTNVTRMLVISKNVKTKSGSSVVGNLVTKAEYTELVDLYDNTRPTLKSARFLLDKAGDKDADKVRVTFDEPMANPETTGIDGDLVITIGGSTITIVSATLDDEEENSIILTLDSRYNISQGGKVSVVKVGNDNPEMNLQDLQGNKLKEGTSVNFSSATTK